MGRDLIIVNVGDGLRGYVNFCQHMGGKLRCLGEHFQCDWHGARYDCRTGQAQADTAAPEGSALEKIELAIEGDDIIYLYTPKKNPWALE
jgi:3-phenylpropionate/trans-cinnamate dioxygenase ferredoxin subunit